MTRSRARACVVLALVGLVPVGASSQRSAQVSAGASSAALLDILQSELQRNVEVLKKEPVPPYFVAYTVYDTQSSQMAGSFGAIVADLDNHSRTLGVDVRTGDYALDNTHEIRGDPAPPAGLGRSAIPLTDSKPGVGVAAWLATDRAYRQSVERLARVKTNLAAKVKEEDPAPDFSREEPQVFVGKPATFLLDKAAWQARLRRLSALFAEDPLILRGEVALSVEANTRYLVSTEGSRLLTGDTACRLAIQAQTKAEDGMELPLYATYYARSLGGLPSEAKLLDDVRSMVATLGKLRTAPVVDPYSGPAILSGRAAGVFFHEIFGHRVEGSRQKTADDAQTFAKKVGQAILPSFLSVVADPTLPKLGDTELAGSYLYDDEGVRARRVAVVKDGVLGEFLLSRSPLASFPKSNGHGRGQPGLRPMSRQSNLIVESSAGVPFAQLVDRLKEEARKAGKPFGLLFDQVEGGFTFTGRYVPNAFNVTPIIVYRVYADGRPMELVRGVDLIGTPLAAFNKIVATDNRTQTFNGICGAESGPVPVSASSPALLVSEVEVQKKAKSQDTLPILPAPSAGGSSAADPPVLRALKGELARSVSGLKMKNEPDPYYVSYSVADAIESGYRATLGALVEQRSTHARVLRADVRVGDYAFDSSRFMAAGLGGAMGSMGLLPTDDNELAMRRQTWLTTDSAYKNAVQMFSRKKAAFENRNDTDPIADFAKQAPVEHIEPVRPVALAPAEWEDTVKEISRSLAVPEVVGSDVMLNLGDGTRYFVNSEGFRIVAPTRAASFRAVVTVLADDGMTLRDGVAVVERPEDLPPRGELLARTRRMLEDVLATRSARVGDDHSGPVLVENEAAATLVSQSFVPLFLARRAPDTDDSRGGGMGQAAVTPFLTRMGNRVLPESFTVKDTPSMTRLGTEAVGGAYTVDDEGVKAQDVTLVQDGRLLTLLTSRTPQKSLPTSNGHARGGGPQAGVFQIESATAVPAAMLRTKYLELLKTQGRPFGYILRRLGPSGGRGGLQVTAAVKVTPDGKEEPVRGLLVGNVTHTTFRDIVAASQERTLMTYGASGGVAVATMTMFSVITPSLIFEELDIQKNKEPLQKKPVVPSPLGR
ncbi:MAG TPA: metallopeptidase TldD-related protein [Vicinamibacterales bacterium]